MFLTMVCHTGLEMVNVRADGHCCFRMYLFLLGLPRTRENIIHIRRNLAAYMQKNRNFFDDVFMGRK